MQSPRSPLSGFSVIEVLVTISLSTIFFSAAAMVYQNVTANSRALSSIESITIDAATFNNLYGLDSVDTINVYSAPNFGRSGFAAQLAQLFQDDVAAASAVYCLGRDGLNDFRPDTITYPAGSLILDTPERLLAHLQAEYAAADVNQFVDYSGDSTAEDASIYILEESGSATELDILSIYDIDVIPISGTGNYVAVRRYVDGSLTGYYDILYPEGTGSPFTPLIVHFYRKGLSATEADANISKYMIAEEMPFYFVWWPDPATRTLEAPVNPPNPTAPAGSAVWDYFQMGQRTQYMFTVPAFPSLQ